MTATKKTGTAFAWGLNYLNAAGSAVTGYQNITGAVDQVKNMSIMGGGGEVTYSEEAEAATTGKEVDTQGTNGKEKKYSQAEIDLQLKLQRMHQNYSSSK